MAHILIAEDEEDVRSFFKDLLMDIGFEVSTAENGEQALLMLEKLAVDLLMVDLVMPKMDGVMLIKKVREINSDIPILVVSGTEEKAKIASALKEGAQLALPKPVRFDVVEEKIMTLLERALLSG